jgi:hypothetical protein
MTPNITALEEENEKVLQLEPMSQEYFKLLDGLLEY